MFTVLHNRGNRPNTIPINDGVLPTIGVETTKRRTSQNPVDMDLFGAKVLTAAASGHVELKIKRPCKLTVLQEASGEKQADVITRKRLESLPMVLSLRDPHLRLRQDQRV